MHRSLITPEEPSVLLTCNETLLEIIGYSNNYSYSYKIVCVHCCTKIVKISELHVQMISKLQNNSFGISVLFITNVTSVIRNAFNDIYNVPFSILTYCS